ncbi:MAG: hypothetical protein KDD61_16915 [Bdellovibrionales bacterium]|nr:hypothetical protein [Bdellovibrionales bacterium]
MKRIILIILLLHGVHAAQGSAYIPAGQKEEGTLAMGYNPDTQEFVGTCLKGRTEKHGRQEANLSFTQSLSESALSKELGMDAGTRFRYGAATVKASAKFMKATKSSGFSISAVYSGDYRFKNSVLVFEEAQAGGQAGVNIEQQRLSSVGRSVRSDDARWDETCGAEYVAQIERGAKLFYSIKIDFMTTEEKSLFEAAFSYDSSYANVSAHLKNTQSNFSKRTTITVGALQIGGDVKKITELFDSESESNGESALGFVKCSFGDLSRCDQVMANAIRYATRDFKKQLDEAPDNPAYEGGPANIRYITKPYSTAGIYHKFSSVMTKDIAQRRRELEAYFDNDLKNLNEVNSILLNRAMVVSLRQNKVLKDQLNRVNANITLMKNAAEICYHTPERCPDEAVAAIQERADFDESVLVIEPEEFRQYCVLAESSMATNGLRKSISGMLKAARELEPSAFQQNPDGKSDDCLQAHMVFQRNSVIGTFKNKQISTLEPLRQYSHFESVDLSDNEVEDLRPLSEWHSLESLILKNNRVRELDPISQLRSLNNLSISNNRLRSIAVMAQSPSLKRIDARNNFETVTCKDFQESLNCMSATVQTDASFSPLATRTSAPLFMPSVVKMKDGNIFIVGNTKQGQVFNASENTFKLTHKMSQSSYAREATALNDGRVLLSGGWSSQKQLTLFDPRNNSMSSARGFMETSRAGHTATLLQDGRVLITGGWEGGGYWTGSNPTHTAEVFDPRLGVSVMVGNMHAPRAWHTATLLKTGKVLIAGGFTFSGGLATAELYDPETNSFKQLTQSMSERRGAHTATYLPSGNVLIVGGFGLDEKAVAKAEIFHPDTNKFEVIDEPLNRARAMHAALLLANGKVLISGGTTVAYTPDHPLSDSPEEFLDRAELFDPVENSFIEVPSKMFLKRARHKMIEVNDGTVLVLGGLSWGSITQSEVFNYVDIDISKQP